jgi:D-beta-D-heptose 7-phosphate kinase/D-beta-D-heptose 1-phosphate adenosyltransferase
MKKKKKTIRKKAKNKFEPIKKSFVQPELIFGGKCIFNFKELKKAVEHCKGLGLKIVFTSGSWDLVHIGHARYLQEAKSHGDILIVGVDNDEKIRARKGPDRPIVPENERMEMITHLKYVDLVTLKGHKDPKWNLIKLVRPHTLIATSETYTNGQKKELKKYCQNVVVLAPKATTTTSAKIRRLQITTAKKMEETLRPKIIETIEEVLNSMK